VTKIGISHEVVALRTPNTLCKWKLETLLLKKRDKTCDFLRCEIKIQISTTNPSGGVKNLEKRKGHDFTARATCNAVDLVMKTTSKFVARATFDLLT
jgi:hypothetical protein